MLFCTYFSGKEGVYEKKAIEKGQLKGKGIGCFVQRGGKTVFKQCTTDQAMAAKTTARGAKLFVIQDPESTKHTRLMKAVKGEGLPRLRAPFENGNLFIIFTIEFPDSLPPTAETDTTCFGGPRSLSSSVAAAAAFFSSFDNFFSNRGLTSTAGVAGAASEEAAGPPRGRSAGGASPGL